MKKSSIAAALVAALSLSVALPGAAFAADEPATPAFNGQPGENSTNESGGFDQNSNKDGTNSGHTNYDISKGGNYTAGGRTDGKQDWVLTPATPAKTTLNVTKPDEHANVWAADKSGNPLETTWTDKDGQARTGYVKVENGQVVMDGEHPVIFDPSGDPVQNFDWNKSVNYPGTTESTTPATAEIVKSGRQALDETMGQVNRNTDSLADNSQRLDNHEGRLDQNENNIGRNRDDIEKNRSDIAKNSDRIDASDARTDEKLAVVNQNIGRVAADSRNYTDQVAGETLGKANAYTDSRYNQLNSKMKKLRGRVDAGVAGATAIGSLTFDTLKPNSVSGGLGVAKNKVAGAIGYQRNFNEKWRARATISVSDNYVQGGTSVGYSW